MKKPIILLCISLTIGAVISLAILGAKKPNQTNPYDKIVMTLSSQLEMEQSTVWQHYSLLHDSFQQYQNTKQKLDTAKQGQAMWSSTGSSDEVLPVAHAEPAEKEPESKRLVGHDGRSKPLPPVYGNTKEQRFINFVRYYAQGYDESVFVNARNMYGIPEELLACIARAETSLGGANKSKNNIMNYGNNDRGDVVHKDSVQQNVYYAAHGLAEGLLSTNSILAELSGAGRDKLGLPGCAESGEYCYATSGPKGYWRVNVYNCMTFIQGEKKDRDNFIFQK